MTRVRSSARRSRAHIRAQAGDPLDGLVNLFDLGMVLALAFLLVGLASALTTNHSGKLVARSQNGTQTRTIASSQKAPIAKGHGKVVGTVYQLANGQLVYTEKGKR